MQNAENVELIISKMMDLLEGKQFISLTEIEQLAAAMLIESGHATEIFGVIVINEQPWSN